MTADGPNARTQVAQRFPLIVGTRSYRTLATVPAGLLLAAASTLTISVTAPLVHSTAFGVVGKVLSIFALCLAISPVALVYQAAWLARHLREAIGCRACDVILGNGVVRVEGGPFHGFEAKLTELAGIRGVELTKYDFCLRPPGARALSVKIPEDPDERASMEALAASLGAAAQGSTGSPRREALPTAIAVLLCTRCGAPLTPSAEQVMHCAYCGATANTPADIADKLKNAVIVDAQRAGDEMLCRALREQPGPTMANVLAFSGGALLVCLTVVAVFLAAVLAFPFDDPDWPPHWGGIGLIEGGLALGLMAFFRERLTRRTALRVLTLGFSALPPERAGTPARCRRCGGPLAAAGDRVLSRCVFCDADNLSPIDLGFDAEIVKRFSEGELSPTRVLARARERSQVTGLMAMVSVVLIVAGLAWQLDYLI